MLKNPQNMLSLVSLFIAFVWAGTKNNADYSKPLTKSVLLKRHRKLKERSKKLSDYQLAIAKEMAEISDALRELDSSTVALGPVYDGGLPTKTGMADLDWDVS